MQLWVFYTMGVIKLLAMSNEEFPSHVIIGHFVISGPAAYHRKLWTVKPMSVKINVVSPQ